VGLTTSFGLSYFFINTDPVKQVRTAEGRLYLELASLRRYPTSAKAPCHDGVCGVFG
jgi:hypothetical protein